jgi:predicted Zn-dependent protease
MSSVFRLVKEGLLTLLHHRLLVFAAAVFGLALAAFGGAHLWASHQFRAAEKAEREDRLDEARERLRLCRLVWPRNADCFLLAARVEREQGDYIQAGKYLDSYRRLKGRTEDYQLELVLGRAQAGHLAELEKGLILCLQKNDPHSNDILETLARCYIKDLALESAHRTLDLLLHKDPDNIRALSWRGWIRERMDYADGAQEDFEHIVRLDPGRWETRLRLAFLYLGQQNVERAERELDLIYPERPNDLQVVIAMVQLRKLQSRLPEARELVDSLLAENPDSNWALYYKGDLETDPAKAAQLFKQVLKKDPTFAVAQYSLYNKLQQAAQALPDTPSGNRKRAQLQQEAKEHLKKYEEIKGDLEKVKKVLAAVEKMPRSPDLLADAGHLFMRLGGGDGALRFLNKALLIDPSHRKANEILAQYYDGEKKPDLAAQYRKAARRGSYPLSD